MKDVIKSMTLEYIAKVCDGEYVGDEALLTEHITGAVIDSRKAEPGNLFVAIPGERVDGHNFANQVIEKGALCVLSERDLPDCKGPYIKVPSTLVAFNRIARAYRQLFDIPVVGVTGSVGKTSTKEMIASVLSQKYKVQKTIKNFNNEWGLPLTLFTVKPEHEILVLEMGIDHFKDMERLAKMAIPDAMVVTNIGTAHLEFLGDRDGILKAKTEFYDYMQPENLIVLNGDDDKLITQRNIDGKNTQFYGINGVLADGSRADIYAENIVSYGFEGTGADIVTPAGTFEARVYIPGDPHLMNAMAATAIGLHFGLSLQEISAGISKAETIEGRSNLIMANGLYVVDDCYNASPLSMKASLKLLASAKGRTIAVLGDMGELGDDELMQHREVGISVADNNIDVLFAAGSLAKEYALGAEGSKTQIHYFEKTEELIPELLKFVKPGDSILIKASHFMGFTEIVERLTK